MSGEAVQFRELGQWHAVLGDTDRTLCGRDAIKAERMYVDWDGIVDDERCRVCLRSLGESGAQS